MKKYPTEERELGAFCQGDSGINRGKVLFYHLFISFSCSLSFKHKDFGRGLSWHPSEPLLLSCGWDGCLVEHSVDIALTEEGW